MELSKKEKLSWLLTVTLLSSITILESYTWGKYILLSISVILFLLEAMKNKGLKISLSLFIKLFALFSIYTLSSSIWAIKSDDSFQMGISLIELLFCFIIVFYHYYEINDYRFFTSAIKWTGIIISLYAIYYYGPYEILSAAASIDHRLDNGFTNANTLGSVCALSSFFLIYDFVIKKRLEILFLIPCILVIAASQSRKALLFLLLSLLLTLLSKYSFDIHKIKSQIRLVVSICVLVALLYFVSQLEVFSGITNRFFDFLSFFSDANSSDGSTIMRYELIQLGFRTWLDHPLLGVGMNNTHIIVFQSLGHDYYFHNNYVELLAGGGIIGFVLYYGIYFYCLRNVIMNRNHNLVLSALLMIWILLMLLMDFGMVSYYSKTQWFYIMFIFILSKKHLKAGASYEIN